MNAIDLGVLAVLALSAILAFARGFTRETLAIGGWIAAVFATIYGFESVRPFAERYIDPGWLSDVVAGAGLFLVTLLVATLLSRAIAHRVQASILGPVDRSLGFAFGLVRGAVIPCLLYLLYVQVVVPEDRPPWVTEARTRPFVEQGAALLLALAPANVRERTVLAIERAAGETRDAVEAKELYDTLTGPGAGGAANDGDVGYKSGDRQDLNRLLETTE
ncbi:MAG: CvpA family protein [Alphaproteobacteria bacterium]